MIKILLSILSGVLSLYSFICLIYIFMTWIPGLRYTKFGQIIASICEPYLGIFSKWRWTRIGNIDFSPIISLGLLSVLSSILARLQATGRIWFGSILGSIVGMFWSVIATFITIFFLLILIRWIVLLINHGTTSYNSAWNQLDSLISKVTYKISGTFIKKPHNYQKSLLVSWIALIVIRIMCQFLVSFIVTLCYSIPF